MFCIFNWNGSLVFMSYKMLPIKAKDCNIGNRYFENKNLCILITMKKQFLMYKKEYI